MVPSAFLFLSEQFYCLPDNYEIKDTSLEDIRVSRWRSGLTALRLAATLTVFCIVLVLSRLQYYCQPVFTKKMIESLDESSEESRALDGRKYLPGDFPINSPAAQFSRSVLARRTGPDRTCRISCETPWSRSFALIVVWSWFCLPRVPIRVGCLLDRRGRAQQHQGQ